MNYNDENVKKAMENVEIPEEVSPENMKKMLDEKAPAKKRSSRISMAGRITAASAACAVIVGAAAGTSGLIKRDIHFWGDCSCSSQQSLPEDSGIEITTSGKNNIEAEGPYMKGAESYKQVYKLLEKAKKEAKKSNGFGGIFFNGAEIEDGVVSSAETQDTMNNIYGAAEDMRADIPKGEISVPSDDVKSEVSQAPEVPDISDIPDIEEPVVQENTEAPEIEEPTEAPLEIFTEEATETVTEGVTEEATEEMTEETTEEENEDEDDYSDTYSQEENVLEADIVKTDGERIYYIYSNNEYGDDNCAYMNVAQVDDGEFTDKYVLDIISPVEYDDEWEVDTSVLDMYVYNDMLVVVGRTSAYCDSNMLYGYDYDGDYFYDDKATTFVNFYTKENIPQYLGTYTQDGWYNDVRIAPDGYMYLISSYDTDDFSTIDDSDDLEGYVPKCGVDNSEYIPCESILLPEDELDNYEYMSYTVIGSIDLTVSGEFIHCDTKALAGYSGDIYSSADNLYTATGWDDTDITRISIGGGQIVPEASGTVEGYTKDQFSFSEYNGYLRVATTIDKWIDNGNFIKDALDIPYESRRVNHNNVYVLDMDMNIVGSVEGFGKDESIKSVSFSGDMGYVVTYEQTDPLFAIDLSDPANPFITDEFKILGYSTYMQKWDEGLLLGFGADADEYGVENGVKLVMFDNSDPYELKEVGLYPIHRDENSYIYSEALWDRKALLIAPKKNLIGVPVTVEEYNHITPDCKYMFFSYENGGFTFKGELSLGDNSGYGGSRAVYIGDYVYAVSKGCFISADIETLTEVDRFYF